MFRVDLTMFTAPPWVLAMLLLNIPLMMVTLALNKSRAPPAYPTLSVKTLSVMFTFCTCWAFITPPLNIVAVWPLIMNVVLMMFIGPEKTKYSPSAPPSRNATLLLNTQSVTVRPFPRNVYSCSVLWSVVDKDTFFYVSKASFHHWYCSSKFGCIVDTVSYTHLTLPTIYSV